MRNVPLMFAISAPSAGGKSTLIGKLLGHDPTLAFSIAATTRPRRPGERDGDSYRFVSHGEFQRLVSTGALIEHAERFGNSYGELRESVEAAAAEKRDILFDTDGQGVEALRRAFPGALTAIYLLPPPRETLERRLRERGDHDGMQDRLEAAERAGSESIGYDFRVENQPLDELVSLVQSIIEQTRRLSSARSKPL